MPVILDDTFVFYDDKRLESALKWLSRQERQVIIFTCQREKGKCYMKIELPRKVLMIINNLQLHGYEAFAVGGCVRDSILARRPEDWDITTSATPEQTKELLLPGLLTQGSSTGQ